MPVQLNKNTWNPLLINGVKAIFPGVDFLILEFPKMAIASLPARIS
ncbi:hypothetical protein [Picosynechococcus sp. PCC 7117]|nr:hypothetical protein [Picosynechococcus sp. PCC 7117]